MSRTTAKTPLDEADANPPTGSLPKHAPSYLSGTDHDQDHDISYTACKEMVTASRESMEAQVTKTKCAAYRRKCQLLVEGALGRLHNSFCSARPSSQADHCLWQCVTYENFLRCDLPVVLTQKKEGQPLDKDSLAKAIRQNQQENNNKKKKQKKQKRKGKRVRVKADLRCQRRSNQRRGAQPKKEGAKVQIELVSSPYKREPSAPCVSGPYCLSGLPLVETFLQSKLKARVENLLKSCGSGSGASDVELVEGPMPDEAPFGEELLRKSTPCPANRARAHLERLFPPDNPDNCNPDELLCSISSRHQSLICHDGSDPAHGATPAHNLVLPPAIPNHGNSCYLTAILCTLANNLAFCELFLAPDWTCNFMRCLKDILQEIRCTPYHTIPVERIKTILDLLVEYEIVPKGDHGKQHDFNEIFKKLLEKVFAAAKEVDSMCEKLKELFYGAEMTKLTCCKCKFSRETTHESTCGLDLRVSNPQTDSKADSQTNQGNTVKDFIDAYLQPENLDGENKVFCNTCKENTETEKVVTLSEVPPVLAIHLHREYFKGYSKKAQRRVSMPEWLEINQKTYFLVASVSHKGNVAQSGHFYSDMMDWETSAWFQIDDGHFHKRDKGVKFVALGPDGMYSPDAAQNEDATRKNGSSRVCSLFYVSHALIAETVMALATARPPTMAIKDKVGALKLRDQNLRECLLAVTSNAPSDLETTDDQKHPLCLPLKPLQRFLSCDLDSHALSLQEPVFSFEDHRCQHGSIAQSAGIIVVPAYFCLIIKDQLKKERNALLGNETSADIKLVDQEVSPDDSDLFCKTCDAVHRNKIALILRNWPNVMRLYDGLKAASSEPSQAPFLAVSAAFARDFIWEAEQKMKAAVADNDIHRVDLVSLPFVSSRPEGDSSPEVNEDIACTYMSSFTNVLFVPDNVWDLLVTLYPKARRCELEASAVQHLPPISAVDEGDGNPDKLAAIQDRNERARHRSTKDGSRSNVAEEAIVPPEGTAGTLAPPPADNPSPATPKPSTPAVKGEAPRSMSKRTATLSRRKRSIVHPNPRGSEPATPASEPVQAASPTGESSPSQVQCGATASMAASPTAPVTASTQGNEVVLSGRHTPRVAPTHNSPEGTAGGPARAVGAAMPPPLPTKRAASGTKKQMIDGTNADSERSSKRLKAQMTDGTHEAYQAVIMIQELNTCGNNISEQRKAEACKLAKELMEKIVESKDGEMKEGRMRHVYNLMVMSKAAWVATEQKLTAANPDDLVGVKLRGLFPKHRRTKQMKWYDGVVVSHFEDSDTGTKLYAAVYNDGQNQDYDKDELKEVLFKPSTGS